MELQWTTMFPYTARMSARRGGTWLLTVWPTADRSRWLWSVQHSIDDRLKHAGATFNPNHSRSQAEHAAARVDADGPVLSSAPGSLTDPSSDKQSE